MDEETDICEINPLLKAWNGLASAKEIHSVEIKGTLRPNGVA